MESTIFRSTRFIVPIQIVVTKELTDEKNLWLHNLTDSLKDTDTVKRLLSEYENQKKEYVISVRYGDHCKCEQKKKFGEVKKMCNALLELMKDDLDERERIGEARGRRFGEQVGEARGKVIGEQQGESRVNV